MTSGYKTVCATIWLLWVGLPFFSSAQQWRQVPGRATDLSIGADGSVWIVDTTVVTGNIAVWRDSNWLPMQAAGIAAQRIAVGPDGKPWFVSNTGQIFYLREDRYYRAPGSLTDIAIGSDGSVYGIGTNIRPGGLGVWRWTDASWNGMSKGCLDLAVDAQGQVWVADNTGRIFVGANGRDHFEVFPGTARAVAINGNHVWVLRPDGSLARLRGKKWKKKKCPFSVRVLAVDRDGLPWIVDDRGKIFRLRS